MKNIYLVLLVLFSGTSVLFAEINTSSITIDSRVKYQHVTGFGGFSPSPTWQYWLKDAEMDMLFGKGEDQLGLNILRLYMANSKNGWSAGVANAKRAKKYGAFVFASPWSPQASWKTNNSDSNGGELKQERYEDWANFLNDYYLYMKKQGVEIDAVSIQNEPDWTADYQSCRWTGEQMAKFLSEYGHLIECKIIAPEAIHFTRSMHEPILNDDDACAQLDILGGHFYGWDGSSYPLAAIKGKEVWMTEFLINERQNNQKLDINWKDDGFLFARSVNDAMLANMSAWVHYSLKRFYGCLGDGQYGTENNKITKRGYILSHYAKYVSGTTRVRHSLSDATGKLMASAYHTESGDSVVVMVINPGADYYNTTLTLPFYTIGGTSIVTTEEVNMVKSILSYKEETYQPEVVVEPYSVNTFVFAKSSNRTDIEDQGEADGDLIFSDNFDVYGASCIPDGWKSKSEEGIRYAGNYSSGPRIMSFSAEGEMAYAFYFRTDATSKGYVCYGDVSPYKISLTPGEYTMYFSTVGWKSMPEIMFSVRKSIKKILFETSATPECMVSTNGSSSRISETTDFAIKFTIEEESTYGFWWEIAKSNGGFNEALIGNIRLIKHDSDNAIESIIIDELEELQPVYNLNGIKVNNPKTSGIYIQGGKKILK